MRELFSYTASFSIGFSIFGGEAERVDVSIKLFSSCLSSWKRCKFSSASSAQTQNIDSWTCEAFSNNQAISRISLFAQRMSASKLFWTAWELPSKINGYFFEFVSKTRETGTRKKCNNLFGESSKFLFIFGQRSVSQRRRNIFRKRKKKKNAGYILKLIQNKIFRKGKMLSASCDGPRDFRVDVDVLKPDSFFS